MRRTRPKIYKHTHSCLQERVKPDRLAKGSFQSSTQQCHSSKCAKPFLCGIRSTSPPLFSFAIPLGEATQNSSSRTMSSRSKGDRQAPANHFSWGCKSASAEGEPSRGKARSYSRAAGPTASMLILELQCFVLTLQRKGY